MQECLFPVGVPLIKDIYSRSLSQKKIEAYLFVGWKQRNIKMSTITCLRHDAPFIVIAIIICMNNTNYEAYQYVFLYIFRLISAFKFKNILLRHPFLKALNLCSSHWASDPSFTLIQNIGLFYMTRIILLDIGLY